MEHPSHLHDNNCIAPPAIWKILASLAPISDQTNLLEAPVGFLLYRARTTDLADAMVQIQGKSILTDRKP
jgi:hypothetical protein